MNLIKTTTSKIDKVEKYIFKNDEGYVLEFSHIDNNTNKDIICVPTHTMCNLGCKFCHTSDYIGQIECKQLSPKEIVEGVSFVVKKKLKKRKRLLLISYMGCGEPLHNIEMVTDSMLSISNLYSDVRFGMATCLPNNSIKNFMSLTNFIKKEKINVKLHFSLHFTNDQQRKEWIPCSTNINFSLGLMSLFLTETKKSVEIHYALMKNINDSVKDAEKLASLLQGRNFNVKFLFYNKKDSMETEASSKDTFDTFSTILSKYNIPCEFYIPPGLDIGASCGQFLMENYLA
jgi:23S rRNA (adenine2503-C2)-methyltransferase